MTVRQFLSQNQSILRPDDLDRFKRVVRFNMYVALIYIALAIPALLISMYLSVVYGLYGLAIVLSISVPQFFFGRYMKSLEVKSRNLPCATEYAAEHQRIGLAWGKNALPDF